MIVQKEMRLKLMSFDCRILDKAVSDIINAISRAGISFKGPIPLPTKIKKHIVNRSTNIDKKSREQFEMKSHFRLLIITSSPQAVEALTNLDIAAGVEVEIKMNR